MKKAWVISLFAVLASLPALGQTAAFNGNCTEGGIPSLTSGLPSSNRLLGVIPHCTVSVYLTGTTTLATIYSDANNTTLTNPFTATPVYLPNSGSWLFYAATGQGYDVVMSGGDPPLTYTSPVTLTDLIIESGGGGSSFTASVNGTPLIVSGSANLINSPSITVTNPSTNQIQFTAVNQGPTVEVNGTPIAPSSPANFVDNSTVTWDFTSGAIHANVVPVPPPTPLSIQHNDSTTGVSQTVLDFNDTTPAPPSGNESVTFQTDVGTGRLSGYVPSPSIGLEPLVSITPIPPYATAIIYPTVGTITGTSIAPTCVPEVGTTSGQIVRLYGNPLGDNTCSDRWSGFGPSFAATGISAGSIAYIYPFVVGSILGNPLGVGSVGFTCTDGTGIASPTYGSAPPNPLNTYSALMTGESASSFNFSTAHCDLVDVRTTGGGNPYTNIDNAASVGMIIYFTGTTIPPTAVQVQPPLYINTATDVLGLSIPYDFALDSGIVNAVAVSQPAFLNLAPGIEVKFLPAFTNTSTAPTVNLNGFGAIPVVKQNGMALTVGDWVNNGSNCCVADVIMGEDGYWELQNPQTNLASGDVISSPFSTLTIGGTPTNTTIDLNLGHANTFTATQTFPNIIITGQEAASGTNCLQIDTSGNVIKTGTTCGSGGGGSLPTAADPGQIISSTAAGTTYAVQGQIFYNQSGDTISSIESECSSLCTYIVTVPQSLTLSANHTLSSNVTLHFEAGGLWTVNGSFTLTIPGNVSGSTNQHFAGSSTILFGQSQAVVPAEWFGAIGYATPSAAVAGTDSTTALQAAEASLTAGHVLLQAECYKTTSALTFNKNNVGLQGTAFGSPTGGFSAPVGLPSCIATSSTSIDILDIGGNGSVNTQYQDFNNFAVVRTAAPNGSAKGISITYTGGMHMSRVISSDSNYDFYIETVPNYATGVIEYTSAFWGYGSVSTSSGNFYGFYAVAGGPSNPFDSLSLFRDFAANNYGPSPTTYGFYITGYPVSDEFLDYDQAETTTYGAYFTSSGGSNFQSADIHLRNGVFDGIYNTALYINGISSAANGSFEVSGNWLNTQGGSYIVDIENSAGINLTDNQILPTSGAAGTTAAVYAHSSSLLTITSNYCFMGSGVSNPGGCLLFNGTNLSTVSGNTLITSGSSATIASLTSTSTWNVVTGNVLAGLSSVCMNADSTSSHNRYLNLNSLDPSQCTTPLADAGTDNELTGGSSGITGGVAGEVAIFGSATTITAPEALAGSGSAITTGPSSSTNLDCVEFTGTAGQIADSGSPCGSGGGSGISGQTPGYAIEAATATTATGPFPLDDSITTANTITAHKNVQIIGSGTVNGFTIPEGAAGTGISATDLLWADSTNHRFTANANNAGAIIFSGVSAAYTSGDCVEFAANGIDLVDAGGVCGTSGGGSAFSAITSGTNTTSAMILGSGSSLNVSGSGTNNATSIGGVTVAGTPTSGQVPTATSGSAATWQTPSSGSVVLLEAHTFSAASGQQFSSWYSSSYDDYLIRILGLTTSASSTLDMQVSSNGCSSYDTTAADYATGMFLYSSGGDTYGGEGAGAVAYFLLYPLQSRTIPASSTDPVTGELEFMTPAASVSKHFHGKLSGADNTGSNNAQGTELSLTYGVSTTFNCFNIYPSTGNFTGTIRVYGVAH